MNSTPDLVVPRIFAALDDHKFDDLVGLYVSDVQADTVMGRIDGRDRLVSSLRTFHEPFAVYQHLVSGVIADVSGDDAVVRANVLAIFGDSERRPALEGASVWRGRLRRVRNVWMVSQFSLDLVWSRGVMPTAATP